LRRSIWNASSLRSSKPIFAKHWQNFENLLASLFDNDYHKRRHSHGLPSRCLLNSLFKPPLALFKRNRLFSSARPVEGVINSQALLKGQREILIKHGDRVYRLRHTSNDKLILTK